MLRAMRWLVALPAGLIAALLVMFPVHWGVVLLYATSRNDPDAMIQRTKPSGEIDTCGFITCFVSAESLERAVQAFVVPFVTLLVVGRIVPSRQFKAVFALFVAYLLVLGAILMKSATSGAYAGWGWLEFAAVIALGVTGAASALFWKFRDWRDSGFPGSP